jgi:hypothetical protein
MKLQLSGMSQNVAVVGFLVAMISASTVVYGATLQDDQTVVTFDDKSGALIQWEDKTTHWIVERRPELGVSFRLFAPLPERRWNPVLGQKQRVTEIKRISDSEIRLRWNNLISENGGVLPMTLTADVTLTNGAVTFSAKLENNSALTVETIDYPYFGDLTVPTRDAPLQIRVATNSLPARLRVDEVFPHFQNEKGYWGVFWPIKTREAQQSRFCLISSVNEGLLAEVPSTPYRLQWTFEQHPGVVSAVNSLVPSGDDIAGTPVHLEFRACHFVFAAPHSTVELTPVTLRCYQGDWQSGLDSFKK